MSNGRVVPIERGNIEDILRCYNMSEYNWIELLKKTRGASMDDMLWFKIDGIGDGNLKYEDFYERAKNCERVCNR